LAVKAPQDLFFRHLGVHTGIPDKTEKPPLHTARNETRKWKGVYTPMRKTKYAKKTDEVVKTLTTDIKSMIFGIYATVG